MNNSKKIYQITPEIYPRIVQVINGNYYDGNGNQLYFISNGGSGTSGSGTSGTSGIDGSDGLSGTSGVNGSSGTSGTGFNTISNPIDNHMLVSDGTTNNAKTSEFVYIDNAGKLHIDTDIIQLGSTYSTHAEQLYTTKDYIILRDGATVSLASGEYAGFQAKLYDGVNDGRLVFGNDGFARVGDVGSEQILATRDILTDKKVPYYNGASFSLTDSSISVTSGGLIGLNMGSYTPTGALDILNGSGVGIFRIQGGSTTNFYSYLNPMVFQTNSQTVNAYDFNIGNTTLMKILANGNVGIGTTGPAHKLQVNGRVAADGNLGFCDYGYTSCGYLPRITGDNYGTITALGGFRIHIFDGLDYNEKFRITPNGSMGIQTSTPTANFQVNQSTTGTGFASNTAGGITVTGSPNYNSNTLFTNAFKIGDTITIGGETQTIISIESDTSMTTTVWTTGHTNVPYTLVGGTRFQVFGNGRVAFSNNKYIQATSNYGIETNGWFSALAMSSSKLVGAGTLDLMYADNSSRPFFRVDGTYAKIMIGTSTVLSVGTNSCVGINVTPTTTPLEITQLVDGGAGIQLNGTGTGAGGYVQIYMSDANGGRYTNINSSHATAYRIGGSLLGYFFSEVFNFYGSASLPKNRLGFSSTLSMGYNYTDSKWYFASYDQTTTKYMTLIPTTGTFVIGGTAATTGTGIQTGVNILLDVQGGAVVLDGVPVWSGGATNPANRVGLRNIGFGSSTLGKNTTGSVNLGIGFTALVNNTTGYSNTGIGYQSLYSNTQGIENIAVGVNALGLLNGTNATLGSRNVGIGESAGYKLTTGYKCTFIGKDSGNNVLQKVDATNSMALGYGTYTTADNQIVIGDTNVIETLLRKGVGIGVNTTYAKIKTLTVGGNVDFNKVGAPNTATMSVALAGLGAGNLENGVYSYQLVYVTAEGETEATNGTTQVTVVDKTTDGQVIISNIPVSTDPRVTSKYLMRSVVNGGIYFCQKINVSLAANATTYTDNIADSLLVAGTSAYRKANTTGGYFYSNGTLFMSSPDIYHTSLGVGAAAVSTTANSYVIIGGLAGQSQTTGSDNVLVGYSSGQAITTGTGNSALGSGTLLNNITGRDNVAIGNVALRTNSNGTYSYNTAVGAISLYGIKPNSNYNTALGYNAGGINDNATGTLSYNIFLGVHPQAYNMKYGDSNLLIGYNADIPTGETTKNNYLNIADVIFGTGIYGSGVGNISTGKIGIRIQDPQATLDVNGGIKISNDSDIASATKVGTLRYRTSGNNSYVDMCMQTGASTYEWVNIVENNW